jgi:hypothetical protein
MELKTNTYIYFILIFVLTMSTPTVCASEQYTLKTGDSLEFGDGFALSAKQIDVVGGYVWVELTLDEKYYADTVIENGGFWNYDDGIVELKLQVIEMQELSEPYITVNLASSNITYVPASIPDYEISSAYTEETDSKIHLSDLQYAYYTLTLSKGLYSYDNGGQIHISKIEPENNQIVIDIKDNDLATTRSQILQKGYSTCYYPKYPTESYEFEIQLIDIIEEQSGYSVLLGISGDGVAFMPSYTFSQEMGWKFDKGFEVYASDFDLEREQVRIEIKKGGSVLYSDVLEINENCYYVSEEYNVDLEINVIDVMSWEDEPSARLNVIVFDNEMIENEADGTFYTLVLEEFEPEPVYRGMENIIRKASSLAKILAVGIFFLLFTPYAGVLKKKGEKRKDSGLSISRENDFYQGFIRLKLSISNKLSHTVTDVALEFDYNDKLLRMDKHEPDYELKNGKIILGNIQAGSSTSLTVLFEPMSCSSGVSIGCEAKYKDAKGRINQSYMEPKNISVVCPIMDDTSGVNINIGRLKELVEKLPYNDCKVYKIPEHFNIDHLQIMCRGVIQRRDVKYLSTLHTTDNKTFEIWYYGNTKVNQDAVVIKVYISTSDSTMELFAATVNEETLTGLLAELGRELKDEIESKVKGNIQQVNNVYINDSVIQRSNLLSFCDANGKCAENIVIEGSVIQRSNIGCAADIIDNNNQNESG